MTTFNDINLEDKEQVDAEVNFRQNLLNRPIPFDQRELVAQELAVLKAHQRRLATKNERDFQRSYWIAPGVVTVP